MKIELDLPEGALQEAIQNTGAKTESEAVTVALSEFNRRCRLQSLVAKFGTSEDFMSQEGLRRMREDA
jgi:hypothetical protein